MPYYRYLCSDCGTTGDYLVKMGEIIKECGECSSDNIERTFDGQTFSAKTKQSGKNLENRVDDAPRLVAILIVSRASGEGYSDAPSAENRTLH